MNSPDISRFCRNAEYREASGVVELDDEGPLDDEAVAKRPARPDDERARGTNAGSSARPKAKYVYTITRSASIQTRLTGRLQARSV